MKTYIAITCVALALSAISDDFVWPESAMSEGVVVLQTSDRKSDESSLENTAHWSPAELDGQYHYWVPADKTIYGSRETSMSFAGKSLTVEGLFHSSDSIPTISHLRFMAGSRFGAYNSRNGIGGGEITIDSTQSNPVTFFIERTPNNFKERPDFGSTFSFVSEADAWLVMKTSQEVPGGLYKFSGCDFSGFYGTLKLLRDHEGVGLENYLTNWVSAATSMPGSYILGTGVVLSVSGSSSCLNASNFTAEAGSRIYNKNSTAPLSTVTGKLTLGEAVDVDANNFAAPTVDTYNTADYVLFKLKDAAALDANLPDPSGINMVDGGCNYWGLRQWGFQDDADEADAKVFAFRSGRSLCTLNSDAAAEGSGETSTFTDGTKWSTGALPAGDENAVVKKKLVVAKDFTEYTFAAGGMVVGAKGELNPMCSILTITNLFMSGGTVYVTDKAVNVDANNLRDMNTVRVRGDYLGVYGGEAVTNTIFTQSARLLVIDYPMHGDGTLWLAVRTTGSYPYGGIELMKVNTNFTGKAVVRGDGNSNCSSEDGKCLQMYLNDARNLGGAMAESTFDGITLRGDAILISTNSLCFNQTNRNIFVCDRARIVMQHETDNTFEVQVPVTYNGELVFGNEYPNARRANVGKGGGTLVLGGEAKFYDEALGTAGDTPVADRNKLTMLVGKLRPASAEAVNGVAVTFGEESDGLEVDYTNETLRATTGFNMTKAGSSLSKAGGGQIPVTFANMPSGEDKVLDVAVCTVPNADAAAVYAKLKPIKVEGLASPVLKVVPNSDGETSTIKADFRTTGFTLVFR